MTAPFGAVRPRTLDDALSFIERLQNGQIPLRRGNFAGPIQTGVRAVTVAYAIVPGDSTIFANAAGGAFAVTLPDATLHKGYTFIVKRMNAGGNAVNVGTVGGQTIEGAAPPFVLGAQYALVRLQSDGANWWQV